MKCGKLPHDSQYQIKMTTRERQENSNETRSVAWGDLGDVGRFTRVKKSRICDSAQV